MSKEMWFSHFERRLNQLIDAGCPDDIAEELAAEKARIDSREQLADLADRERKIRRGE